MDTNFFSLRDQIIFITYQDIIKQNYALLIETLIKDYYDDLNPILKLEEIRDYDMNNLQRLCVERTHKNPLCYLARDESHYNVCDELLNTFESEFIEMYTNANFTEFGAKLYNVLIQPFVKKIYIHTEKTIYQIPYDCELYFKDFSDKIEYVYGDFKTTIDSLEEKPTTYILNDVDYAKVLLDNELIEYTELLIGELGYNFELTKDYDITLKHNLMGLMQEKTFKVGMLPIINLKPEHFSCLDEIKEDTDPV